MYIGNGGIVHYFSVFSGPLYCLVSASAFCLVPGRNILEQPQYWYEDQIARFAAIWPGFIVARLVEVVYWADFKLVKGSYLILGLIAFGVHLSTLTGYYFLWNIYYNYSLPLPFNFFFGLTSAFIVTGIATWFRLVFQNLIKVWFYVHNHNAFVVLAMSSMSNYNLVLQKVCHLHHSQR